MRMRPQFSDLPDLPVPAHAPAISLCNISFLPSLKVTTFDLFFIINFFLNFSVYVYQCTYVKIDLLHIFVNFIRLIVHCDKLNYILTIK